MNTAAIACWRARLGLLLVAVLLGCNAKRPDLETQIQDTTAIKRIVDARIAEEKLPLPVITSIQTTKPDEAIATMQYGEPQRKTVLKLKKLDGKWTIQQP
jgi:hypothetical protein